MNSEAILNLFNNCVFPIAMCIIMIITIKFIIEKFQKILEDERKDFKETVDKLTTTNTGKIEKLTDSIGELVCKIDILLDRRE